MAGAKRIEWKQKSNRNQTETRKEVCGVALNWHSLDVVVWYVAKTILNLNTRAEKVGLTA